MRAKERPVVTMQHDTANYLQDLQKSAAFRIVTEMTKRGYAISLLYKYNQSDVTQNSMVTSCIFGDKNSLHIFKTVYKQIAQTIDEAMTGEDPDTIRLRRTPASETAEALHSQIKDVVEQYPGMVLSSESS